MDEKTTETVAGFRKGENQLALPYQLSTLNTKLNRHAASLLKAHGLTLVEWRVLYLLTEVEQATLTQLHAMSGVDRGQLSRAIKRLVTSGHLVAQTQPGDQRNRPLKMTQWGHQQAAPAHADMNIRRQRIHRALGEDGAAQMLAHALTLHEFLDVELGEVNEVEDE